MKTNHSVGTLLLLAALYNPAHAQLSREQVKAQWSEAVRSGNVLANGELGLKLNQLNPGSYAIVHTPIGKSRDQVVAELAEAMRTGNLMAGETGLSRRELEPQRYPTIPQFAVNSRAEVKAELAEAIRRGDMPASGESGMTLHEVSPGRYAAARALPTMPAAGMALRTPR
jgi:hypothetical protein